MKIKNVSIEEPVHIKLEGKEVLKFITKDDTFVKYGVVGFTGEQIKIHDYRKNGLKAIDTVVKTNSVKKFPRNFCFPSLLRLSHTKGKTLIELYDLEIIVEPELILWITTELEEPIPDYEYPFFQIESLTDSTFSFVSLFNYQRFQNYFLGNVNRISSQVYAEI